MKFHLQKANGQNAFTGYGAGYTLVNSVRYEHSLVVTPERICEDWRVANFDALSISDSR